METAAWPYRLTAPVLPSGIDDRAHDVALLAAWALVTASLAMLGLRAGQGIDWEFPDGSRRRLRADAVLQQPERNRAGSPR